MAVIASFKNYQTDAFFDEMFESPGRPRHRAADLLCNRIESLPAGYLERRQKAAELAMLNMGITFTVYGKDSTTERIFPFDIVPRTVSSSEFDVLQCGLEQRIRALNMFIDDIYHDQNILKEGVIPRDVVFSGEAYLEPCAGLDPPRGVWAHITGTDLVRGGDGQFYILEDNMRCPSGVSYVLENRLIMKRTFPRVFEASNVRAVDDYPNRLFEALRHLAPDHIEHPTVVVLTPGMYNSAYFEHSFLAQQMGVELVEGRDLVVNDGYIFMRTTKGFQRVDVIYRRIDDNFIDPKAFRKDSMLGVPGLMDVYRNGRVALANAPGTGIADDKVVYAYVPEIIKFYLSEEAILPNVPTYLCWEKSQRDHVLGNLENLVVKAANESGGYGMLVGSASTAEERADFADRIKANPRNYIAQPILDLSRVPVLVDDHFEGRHVDLRPYVIYGKDIWVMPGGLTRVALKKGSLVVNSSQGGGSKDTWVVSE